MKGHSEQLREQAMTSASSQGSGARLFVSTTDLLLAAHGSLIPMGRP